MIKIMISISNNSRLFILLALAFIISLTLTNLALAETPTTQTLSVSPTLFQMSVNPSQAWVSELRVTNVNDFDIIIYPQVVNFAPLGESGRGDLIPVFTSETKGSTLAEWIKLDPVGVLVPKQETKTLSFTVNVPPTAAPGGHYAAILIGTKPPTAVTGKSQVQTAQFVTSLFFVRVAGDVTEKGIIREFRTTEKLLDTPHVTFELRFENEGNVHLQPQGDIVISNMWGEERGIIPINQQTHFGNVLPQSVRKFEFTWSGVASVFDIGRYKAIATLGYGEESKNFVTSTTYFWIVPIQQILITLVVMGFLIWLFTFAVRMYVRRMLTLAGIEPRTMYTEKTGAITAVRADKTVIIKRYRTVAAPVIIGLRELKKQLFSETHMRARMKVILQSFYQYRLLVGTVLGFFVVMFFVILFIQSVTKPDVPYSVTITNPDSSVTLSSEQIIYNDLEKTKTDTKGATTTEQNFAIKVINVSGVTGQAARARLNLESAGYKVGEIGTDPTRIEEKSAIVYNGVPSKTVLEISKLLNNALPSASAEIDIDTVVIYVGTDFVEN